MNRIRYINAAGGHEYGPECGSPSCAVLSISPFEGRMVDAVMDGDQASMLPAPKRGFLYLGENWTEAWRRANLLPAK